MNTLKELNHRLAMIIIIIKRPLITRDEFDLCRNSSFFDAKWYLSHNPDVKKSGLDPLEHYLLYGGIEGRDPSDKFSSQWYMDTYKDIKKVGINPLIHYLKYGKNEGRKTKN